MSGLRRRQLASSAAFLFCTGQRVCAGNIFAVLFHMDAVLPVLLRNGEQAAVLPVGDAVNLRVRVGEIPLRRQFLVAHGHDLGYIVHPAEGPRHRRLLTGGQAGLGQVHGKHSDVAVQALVHGPQVIQHPEVQGAAVIKAVGPEIHLRDSRQLAGVGLQHQIVGNLHQRTGQGFAGQVLIRPRLVPVEGFAVQCQLYIMQGQGIHLRRVSLRFGQQEPVRFFLNDPEVLPDRFCLLGPGRRLILRPAGIAGAVCPPTSGQQTQA